MIYTNLNAFAESDAFDAVYIASPNSFMLNMRFFV